MPRTKKTSSTGSGRTPSRRTAAPLPEKCCGRCAGLHLLTKKMGYCRYRFQPPADGGTDHQLHSLMLVDECCGMFVPPSADPDAHASIDRAKLADYPVKNKKPKTKKKDKKKKHGKRKRNTKRKKRTV